ncbi:MAG: glycoside hydrolase family 16 protein [Muribaculaceae bacterium]|nr:glycoside hydrolase family 16 protein [Muribaculaceae bacterium]
MALLIALGAWAKAPSLDTYRMVWSDEFDGTTLNSAIWNIEVNGNGGGNNELQYYASENVSVSDGCLMLTARKENRNGRAFTSGRINSLGKAAFMHGRIDARLKMPHTANGLWPAFWLMGNDMATGTGWPYCGEIDVMEAGNVNGINRGTQDRYMGGALHWGPYGAQTNWQHPMYATDLTAPYSLQDDFHLFTLVWDYNRIEMYLDLDIYPDASPYFRMSITDQSQENSPGRYFHKQFFILFNVAVGGDYTGIHDTAGITALANEERSMLVDYVRVYQREGHEDYTIPGGSAVDPGPDHEIDNETDLGEYAKFALDDANHSTFDFVHSKDFIIIDADPQFRELVADRTLADYSPDVSSTSRLMIWNSTYNQAGTSGLNSMGFEEPWRHYTVSGKKNWSTLSYRSTLSDTQGKDLSMLNDEYYVHVAMRGNDFDDHTCHAIHVGNASFTIGNEPFDDGGTPLPIFGDYPRDGRWVAFDIPYSKLLELSAQPFVNAGAFTGDVISFLSGGEWGAELEFDALFFYKPNYTGVSTVHTDNGEGNSVAYDLLGRPVGPGYRGIVIRNGKKYVVQ